MASLEYWQEKYSKIYTAEINLEDGTWTYTDGALTKVFNNRSEWLRYVQKERDEALRGLLGYRDFASEIQQLPGTKPLFVEEGEGGLSENI